MTLLQVGKSMAKFKNRALLSFHLVSGTVQERLFVDIGEEGQVVGANITLSG